MVSRLKEAMQFDQSDATDSMRKELTSNIKQAAFYRWKLMHANSTGAKMDHD